MEIKIEQCQEFQFTQPGFYIGQVILTVAKMETTNEKKTCAVVGLVWDPFEHEWIYEVQEFGVVAPLPGFYTEADLEPVLTVAASST